MRCFDSPGRPLDAFSNSSSAKTVSGGCSVIASDKAVPQGRALGSSI